MTSERVPFRLIVMPCCGHNVCWINPRLPSHCSECGVHVYPQVRSAVMYLDLNALLTYHSAALGEAAARDEKAEMQLAEADAVIAFELSPFDDYRPADRQAHTDHIREAIARHAARHASLRAREGQK